MKGWALAYGLCYNANTNCGLLMKFPKEDRDTQKVSSIFSIVFCINIKDISDIWAGFAGVCFSICWFNLNDNTYAFIISWQRSNWSQSLNVLNCICGFTNVKIGRFWNVGKELWGIASFKIQWWLLAHVSIFKARNTFLLDGLSIEIVVY